MTLKILIVISMLSSTPALTAENANLIAFVGERISVKEFQPDVSTDTILFDLSFKAKYKVKEIIYGSYTGETIEFEAYDHYGTPKFSQHKNVLIFVSRHEDMFYHQKYQYFPVFKTLSGVWAGCGSPYRNEPKVHHRDLKASPMDFGPDAYLEIDNELSPKEKLEQFPAIDFRIKGNKAFCLRGNPVSQLFEVKREGVLKARGLFGDGS